MGSSALTCVAASFVFLGLSTASPDFRRIHHLMNRGELLHYFGTYEVDSISSESYDLTHFMLSDNEITTEKRGDPSEDASKTFKYTFAAFGSKYELNLTKNDHLLSSRTVIARREGEDSLEAYGPAHKERDCHFQDIRKDTVAAVSVCQERVRGMIYTGEHLLEIHPLGSSLHRRIIEKAEAGRGHSLFSNNRTFVFVRRRDLSDVAEDIKRRFSFAFPDQAAERNVIEKRAYHSPVKRKKYVELAIFLDEAAYRRLDDFFGHDEYHLSEYVVAYTNAIDALYHLPSLHGVAFDFTLVRMEILARQPADLPAIGDRDRLYETFCEWQAKKTPKDDTDLAHWDLALLLSGEARNRVMSCTPKWSADECVIDNLGLDFYDPNTFGRHRHATMGLSYVDGVCVAQEYACVIAEVTTTGAASRDAPYPSTSMSGSALVAGHEVGHNLGLNHDSSPCDSRKYIMASSRGTIDKNSWSPCSSRFLSSATNLDCLDDKHVGDVPPGGHKIGGRPPGLDIDAREQCVLFLLDPSAYVEHEKYTPADTCSSIRCLADGRHSPLRAGPALEGTPCGKGKWCSDGICTSSVAFDTGTSSSGTEGSSSSSPSSGNGEPQWSDWMDSGCTSGCLKDAKGVRIKRRRCLKELKGRKVPADGCPGAREAFDFCDDSSVCGSRRLDWRDYVARRCLTFSDISEKIKPSGQIVRAAHDRKELWPACAVYCERTDGSGFYAPVVDLEDFPGVDPYFPEGTQCHTETKADGRTQEKFYCQKNLCLSERSRIARSGAGKDFYFGEGSAKANPNESLVRYFSLNPDGSRVEGGSPEVPEGDEEEEVELDDEVSPP